MMLENVAWFLLGALVSAICIGGYVGWLLRKQPVDDIVYVLRKLSVESRGAFGYWANRMADELEKGR